MNKRYSIDILGTKYKVEFRKEIDDKKLIDADGYAELYSKELIIEEIVQDERTFKDLHKYKNKVIRHEIIHAFFHEAGYASYCKDEVLIEALSMLTPKMFKAFKQMKVEED